MTPAILALAITIAACFFITWIVIDCEKSKMRSWINFLEDQIEQKDKHIDMLRMDLDDMRRRKSHRQATDSKETPDQFGDDKLGIRVKLGLRNAHEEYGDWCEEKGLVLNDHMESFMKWLLTGKI